MSEFKPGDVGMVRLPDGTEVRAMLDDEWMGRSVWRSSDGRSGDAEYADVRPVVVLDPEDREQVERFTQALIDAGATSIIVAEAGGRANRTQAALREFAQPVPPQCGRRIGMDFGKTGTVYTCGLNPDHGPHVAHHDAVTGVSWSEGTDD